MPSIQPSESDDIRGCLEAEDWHRGWKAADIDPARDVETCLAQVRRQSEQVEDIDWQSIV